VKLIEGIIYSVPHSGCIGNDDPLPPQRVSIEDCSHQLDWGEARGERFDESESMTTCGIMGLFSSEGRKGNR